MKVRLNYLIASVLAGGVLVAAPVVLAESGSGSSGSDSSSSTSSNSSSSSSSTDDVNQTETVKTETNTKTREDRLKTFKTVFKINLTLAEAAKLKLHCTAAQSVISKLNDKFGDSVTVRTKAYNNLQAKLNDLVTKLKAKNVDTTTLEQQIAELNTKIATYNTDLAAYKQSLADLKTGDCTVDANAFQAGLQAARAAHDKLVADALTIRTYVVGTIRPTLQTILKSLETSNSTSNTSSGSN